MTAANDDDVKQEVTLFMCGPNRLCDHQYDQREPLLDRDRNIVGETMVCSRCGQSAFEASLWEAY